MSRGRPRQFDFDQALDAALILFWRHGYEGTSLAALAQVMGINMPSLYSAFGNLDIPVFYDLDIGHVPPQMLLVNGASATFTFAPEQKTLCQTLR